MKNIFAQFASIAILLPMLFGFSLLSGPNEATLPVSVDQPHVKFYWDGSVPKISDKDSYLGGEYSNLSDEQFIEKLLERAFGTWNSVKGSYLRMDVERQDDTSIDSKDDVNVIGVKGGVNLSAAAFANPILSDSKRTIQDCDIVLSKNSTKGEDLLYTLIHEIGHCVGLGHAHTNYNSIMGYSRISRNPHLGADDKAGIIFLYPDPEYASKRKEFLGCAVLGTNKSGTQLFMLFLLLFLPIAGVTIRFRSHS